MTVTYLDKIVEFHRQRAQVDTRSLKDLALEAQAQPECRGFIERLRRDSLNHLAVISEIKRRSPSKGNLRSDLNPASLAKDYEEAGASCLSVLTDEAHFGGSINDLQIARNNCNLPVLRKDFTVAEIDVFDARIMGADCLLLIVAALGGSEIENLYGLARSLDLDVLVEIHDEKELDVALKIGAEMIGVNQRDLFTFEVDSERATRVGQSLPDGIVRVAESGIRGRDDAIHMVEAGFHAVLVGESLVTANDPKSALRELLIDR